MQQPTELTDSFGKSTERGPVTLLPEPEPRDLWCPIISVDDHVIEPFDLFADRLSRHDPDEVPHVELDDDGVPAWIIDGARVHLFTSEGAVGRPIAEWTMAPAKLEELRPGTHHVHA